MRGEEEDALETRDEVFFLEKELEKRLVGVGVGGVDTLVEAASRRTISTLLASGGSSR